MKKIHSLIFITLIAFSCCKKENKELYGDWATHLVVTSYPVDVECSITSFGKFGRFKEHSSSNCNTKTELLRKGKYSFNGEVLKISALSITTSFTLIEDRGNELYFSNDNVSGVLLTLVKL